MSFSNIPFGVYIFLVWYALGVYAIGALSAAIVWDRQPMPEQGRHWIWIFALTGGFLFAYVWCIGDLWKGFALPGYGTRRLKEKVEEKYRQVHKLQQK